VSQQINLFNPVFLTQRKVFTAAAMARALVVLAAGALALAAVGHQRLGALRQQARLIETQLAKREAALTTAKAAYPPRQKDPALQVELRRAEEHLAALKGVRGMLSDGALGNPTGPAATLRALAHQHVEGVWLTRIGVEEHGHALDLNGRTVLPELVPRYIARLAAEPALQGAAFGGLQIARPAPPAAAGSAASVPASEAPYLDFVLHAGADAPEVK
jgi:hypothetical protein